MAGYSVLHTSELLREREARRLQSEKIDIPPPAPIREVPLFGLTMLPLVPIGEDPLFELPVDRSWVARTAHSDIYDRLSEGFFREYPGRSLMSNKSRTFLFLLARALKPHSVAEIGTFFAG